MNWQQKVIANGMMELHLFEDYYDLAEDLCCWFWLAIMRMLLLLCYFVVIIGKKKRGLVRLLDLPQSPPFASSTLQK